MSLIKAFFGIIACVWIAAIVAYAVSGPAVVEGSEIVSEKMVVESGLKDHVVKVGEERCLQHQENFDKLWERSIEKGSPESMEDALRRAEIAVETYC
ncbi:hypothetical protein [Altererythrobacter sp. MF3-039]|uniref:hypothetical protein n=1 Tax=Altererythrobacter sp. MF3-039 TaxID=3252901 RepID=UPI00390C4BAC